MIHSSTTIAREAGDHQQLFQVDEWGESYYNQGLINCNFGWNNRSFPVRFWGSTTTSSSGSVGQVLVTAGTGLAEILNKIKMPVQGNRVVMNYQ